MTPLQRSTAIILALLLAFIYLTRLGQPGFLAPGEGRYAEGAQAMLLTGDWVVPRVNGQVHLEKPPLLYWLAAASFSVFGVSEASARLVPALCSLLAAFILFLLGGRLYGEKAGWLAFFILLTGLTWSVYGRFLTTDIPAIAFLTTALWAYWRARETGARRYLLAFSGALAAGVLTRGLLALVFPVILIVAFSLIRRQWKPRDPAGWLWAALLFAALTVPWHAAVEMRIPGFLHHYFIENHLARFLGKYPPPGTISLSLWKFWLASLAGLLPWTFFLPAVIAETWRSVRREKALSDADLFSLLWIGSVLIFVSVSEARLERYFLPAFPGFALWVGGRLSQFAGEDASSGASRARIAAAAAIVVTGLGLAWVPLWPRAPEFIPQGKGVLSLLPWIGSVLTLGGVFAMRALMRGRPLAAAFGVVWGTMFAVLGAQQAVARLDPFLSMRQVSGVLLARDGIQERVIVDGYYEIHEGMDAYSGRSLYEGLEFYSGRKATVMRTGLGKNEWRIRWDAAYHPHIEPYEFEKLWARGGPAVFITRWGATARQLIFHYPERTRVIAIYDSAWVLANHNGEN
ncbi:MAG: ArnT family glycosyltransferase [Nitrospinota bacterium]